MKSFLKKIYNMPVFMTVLWLFSALAKFSPSRHFTLYCMNVLGIIVSKIHSSSPKDSLEKIAGGWTEQMPKPKEKFPITYLSDTVAIGEIHVHCPLRGTGNLEACYTLMQFDRSIVERMGGKLIVIESQASSQNDYCKVAICKSKDDWDGLKSAWSK
ncbi:MAG: hypothetical protein WCK67_03490 [bacterium]